MSEENKIETCAFTGHRNIESDFSTKNLKKAVEECIRNGCKIFYCGMARGFDLIAAKIVEEKKKNGADVKLIACLPCPDQSKYYSAAEKKEYEKLCSSADEVVLLSDAYTAWCMAKRNEYMADRADALIAYCNKDFGGTAYTLRYFLRKKQGKIFRV